MCGPRRGLQCCPRARRSWTGSVANHDAHVRESGLNDLIHYRGCGARQHLVTAGNDGRDRDLRDRDLVRAHMDIDCPQRSSGMARTALTASAAALSTMWLATWDPYSEVASRLSRREAKRGGLFLRRLRSNGKSSTPDDVERDLWVLQKLAHDVEVVVGPGAEAPTNTSVPSLGCPETRALLAIVKPRLSKRACASRTRSIGSVIVVLSNRPRSCVAGAAIPSSWRVLRTASLRRLCQR